jgi:hypothetical protein
MKNLESRVSKRQKPVDPLRRGDQEERMVEVLGVREIM